MQLRQYQIEAMGSCIAALDQGHNPVLQLATGTGKSLIIAALCQYYRSMNKKVWMLTHVQQLVKQNAEAYNKYTEQVAGIVCAGLNRKDLDRRVTFGTIQSMTNILSEIDEPSLIIIDEAHRVPHNFGEPTLYETILRRYPNAQRVAMTATPWRMDNGIIYGDGEEFFFDKLAYNYPVTRAVRDGWLCPLVGVESSIQLNMEDVSVGTDFVQKEAGELVTEEWLESVAMTIDDLASERNHLAVYCPTVKSANLASKIIQQVTGRQSSVLTGDMSQDQRDKVLSDLKDGTISVLCSVDMITTGFDFPPLDCIICLRPTLSSSLWVQMQGRGTRLHETKKNCLVLDFAGNLIRLGGVDMYETFFKENGEEVEAVASAPYVRKERKIYPGLTTLNPIDPMTGKDAENNAILELDAIHKVNAVSIKTRNSDFPMMMVTYTCSTPENARIDATLFINTASPKEKDFNFFEVRRLATALPTDAKRVSYQIRDAIYPAKIKVRKNGRYWNVVSEMFEAGTC